MAFFSSSSVVFLLLAFVGTLSVVEGIKCYQCGTYVVTSVTPCQNLTAQHLKECPPEKQFCSKYSNPAIKVYGCEEVCQERVQNSFEIHCCSDDGCNGAEALKAFWILLVPFTLTAVFNRARFQ